MSHQKDCHVYLLDLNGELVLIDAGFGVNSECIIQNIREEGFNPFKIKYLFVTHVHADHAGGCLPLKKLVKCKVVAPEIEAELLEKGSEPELGIDIMKKAGLYPKAYRFQRCKPDIVLNDGEEFKISSYSLKLIQIPGHSLASSCYLVDLDGYRALFSSDIVFYGGAIGLGNWRGSSLSKYRENISKLSDLKIDGLFPGHFLWVFKGGQTHVDKAISNLLDSPWVPPAWQHLHPIHP